MAERKAINVSIGDKFGEWTVVGNSFKKRFGDQLIWHARVQCSCGYAGIVLEYRLKNGKSKSCRQCFNASKVKVKGLPGEKNGVWTVIREEKRIGRDRTLRIKCSCGYERLATPSAFLNSNPSGCRKCLPPPRFKHGLSALPEYFIYRAMISRCYNKLNPAYENYGGRGVTVCDRWNPLRGGSFENFINDVGRRPGPNFCLDKEAIDPRNLTYSPDFVKWRTTSENAGRKRSSVIVSHMGEDVYMCDLARRFNLDPRKLYRFMSYHRLSAEDAIKAILEQQANEKKA